MEIKTFPLGSKVKLKTGGPVMTVTGYDNEFGENKYRKFTYISRMFNHVICTLNDGNEAHQVSYHISTLEVVEEAGTPDTIFAQ